MIGMELSANRSTSQHPQKDGRHGMWHRPAATDVVDSQSQVIGIPSYLSATGGASATRYYFVELSTVRTCPLAPCARVHLMSMTVQSLQTVLAMFHLLLARRRPGRSQSS